MISRGSRLGPYEVLAPLGAGGMGEVYRARDTRVGREVAVKILPRDFAADPQRRRRFEQEARLAASLNHPNIVGLFDVGPDLDPPYIVSELVPGVSLRAVMNRGAIPLRRILDLAAQMAEGLAAAHAAGVVHRDIKPENVMVTPEGRVKILDFGLARVQEGRGPDSSGSQTVTVGPETPHPTSPGMVVGTVAYMSPEQASGHTVDYRSDQFSLGLVLYEMLSRRRAFERASTAQTMAAIIEDEAPPLPATVPTQVRWVVERCLSKDPPKRYASTQDLAQELRQLGEHISDLTSPSSGTAVASGPSGRRLPVRVAAAGVLILLLLSLRALYVEKPLPDLAAQRIKPLATLRRVSEFPSWSPDGKSFAFLGVISEADRWQIWVQGTDSPTPVQITRSPFMPVSAPIWSPDSRMLYCVSYKGLRRGIYRIPVAGGEPVLVQADAHAGTLSPDGKTLVMYAKAEGEPDDGFRIWYASPPDAPRRLYEPSRFMSGSIDAPVMAFSPDGKQVLYAKGGATWVLLPWPTGKARRLPIPFVVNGCSWMPDSRHVVYSDGGSLNLADTKTGRHWVVVGGGVSMSVRQPSVSPDGRRIACVMATDNSDVIQMPLDGSQALTLIGTSQQESEPALSADGKELVYTTDARGEQEIWSMRMADRSVRRLMSLKDVPADSGSPVSYLSTSVLSPDGKRIAFAAASVRGPRIYVAFTAGGAPVRATSADDRREMTPTWSPEDDRLAYIGGKLPFSLLVVRPGSADPPARIWQGQTWVPPAWSPTGEWISVADSTHIVLVSPDGRARRDLRSEPGAMAWAPDGRTLYVVRLFANPPSISAIDIRSGSERWIRDVGDHNPGHSPFARVSVTPDGKSLIYSAEVGGAADIYQIEGVEVPAPWYRRLWPW